MQPQVEYPNLFAVLEYVVREEKKKSVLDRLARAITEDMIVQAIYDAIRVIHHKGPVSVQGEELWKEVNRFLEKARRNPTVSVKLACEVLARTYEPKVQEQVATSKQQGGQAAEAGRKG